MINTIHRELGTIEAVGATSALAAHSCTATHQALTSWSRGRVGENSVPSISTNQQLPDLDPSAG
jgi:hypothetical protein